MFLYRSGTFVTFVEMSIRQIFYKKNSNNYVAFFVSVCVQWPEGRCIHDVPEEALQTLYSEIRENCQGFS